MRNKDYVPVADSAMLRYYRLADAHKPVLQTSTHAQTGTTDWQTRTNLMKHSSRYFPTPTATNNDRDKAEILQNGLFPSPCLELGSPIHYLPFMRDGKSVELMMRISSDTHARVL